MSAYCKCYHCGAEDGIDIDDGVCDKCGYPDRVIAELEDRLSAALALNKNLIHAQELDLAEKAELRAEVERLRTALIFEPCPPEPDTGPDPDYFDDEAALAEKE